MLEYFEVGEGSRSMLMLHGFLGSGRNLSTVARRLVQLRPELRILLPDLTGHGGSPARPEDADLGTLARDVLETAAAAGLGGELEIVGHSLGGRVGLKALQLAPERVRKVTLLDIPPGSIESLASESGRPLELLARAPATGADRETFRAWFLGEGLSAPLTEWLLTNLEHTEQGYRWRLDRPWLVRLHPRVNAADLWQVAETWPERIGCIRGGRSPYVGAEEQRRMEQLGIPVETLDAGHFLHVTRLEELVALLAR